MEITKIRLKDIKPYGNNAKLHPKTQIEQIKKSIQEFGNNDPIAVDEENVIIEGHGRYQALKELGFEEAECIILRGLTEDQKNAYRLVHNKLTMNSDFDLEALYAELEKIELDMTEFDFSLPEPAEPDYSDKDLDDTPEVNEENPPKTKPGELYRLGNHYLLCGDSEKPEDVDRLMQGAQADMVFTDPPWNVDYGSVAKGNPQGYKPRTIANDNMSTEAFKEFMYAVFRNMDECSKPGCMTYVVMSAQEWGNLMLALADNEYHWSSTIIWNKDRLVLSRKDYHTRYEPIWYGWKEGQARLHPLEDRTQCDVWDINRPSKSDEHPTMKPVELVARAIINSSNKGDLVLDLFGGSGTTLIASEKTGRRCRMMELDPKYCDVIIRRWENMTGGNAELMRRKEE